MFYNNTNPQINSDVRVNSTTGTADSIVTLEEAKNYLRVTNTQDDTLITAMISNAILQAEKYLNSDILAKTRTQYVGSAEEPFNLYYAPVASVQTVTIDGQEQSTETYQLKGLDNPLVCTDANGVNVVVNYTTQGITDGSVKQGVLALIAWLYYRGEAKMPTNWKSWLSPFKTFGYYGVR